MSLGGATRQQVQRRLQVLVETLLRVHHVIVSVLDRVKLVWRVKALPMDFGFFKGLIYTPKSSSISGLLFYPV